nr:hypothetical protein [Tanacetum cinerariifolium]
MGCEDDSVTTSISEDESMEMGDDFDPASNIKGYCNEKIDIGYRRECKVMIDELKDKVIKSSVEDLVLILSESEDTSGSDSECDLSLCDDLSPINVLKGKSVTFYNPLFNSNDDFTSSDDESLSDEDVPEDNVKIYSNILFEFDDEYISNDVNSLFDEVLEYIKVTDSYKLDESALKSHIFLILMRMSISTQLTMLMRLSLYFTMIRLLLR